MIVAALLVLLAALAAVEVARGRDAVKPELPSSGRGRPGVARSIARAEATRLLRHPAIALGFAFTILAMLLTQVGARPVMERDDVSYGLFVFPMAGMTMIAMSLIATRARRDGTRELLGALPAPAEQRTGGLLIAGGLGGLALGIAAVAIPLAATITVPPIGTPSIAELATGPFLVACAGVLGVTAATLLPSGVIGVATVIAMGAIQGMLDHFSGGPEHALNHLAPWVSDGDTWVGSDLFARRPGTHLVYLAGLGGICVVAALARHRRDRLVAAGAVVAVLVAGAAGVVQSRPYTDDDFDRAAAVAGAPADDCITRETVTYCAFNATGDFAALYAPAVEGVLRVLPPSVRARPLAVKQRFPAQTIWLQPPSITSRFPAGAPRAFPDVWPPSDGLYPNLVWCGRDDGSCHLSMASATASWAVGLPLAPTEPTGTAPEPWTSYQMPAYDASGEARAVVALWLAARATPQARAHFAHITGRPAPEGATPGETFQLIGCEGIVEAGAGYGIGDAAVVAALLARPEAEVASAIARHWDTLVDPRTTSDTFINLMDLPAPASAPSVVSIC